MAVYCTELQTRVLYQICQECETKTCRRLRDSVYSTIVIGIDQSYQDTGVSICADGVLKNLSHFEYPSGCDNSYKRFVIKSRLEHLLSRMQYKARKVVVVIERIRLQSQGFLNIDYIKSIGALNAVIVDTARLFNIEVYSVDTRCWKSQVVGTSKEQNNKWGIDPKKWPTIQFIIKQGYEDKIKVPVSGRKKKGVIEAKGERFTYNDNIADSACIALFWFRGDRTKLILEH